MINAFNLIKKEKFPLNKNSWNHLIKKTRKTIRKIVLQNLSNVN